MGRMARQAEDNAERIEDQAIRHFPPQITQLEFPQDLSM